QRVFEMALVNIHDVRDADVGNAGKMLVVIVSPASRCPGGMALVAAAQADDGDVDRVARDGPRVAARGQTQRHSGRCGGGVGKKAAPIHEQSPMADFELTSTRRWSTRRCAAGRLQGSRQCKWRSSENLHNWHRTSP